MKIWLKANIFQVLDIFKALGILVLLLMVIRFGALVAKDAQLAKQNTASTQQLVKGETVILKAIQRLELDGQLNSEQKLEITICMLKVPVEQRTTDLEAGCRKQVAASPSASLSTVVVPTGPSSPAPTQSPAPASPQPTTKPTPTPSPPPSPNPIQRLLNFFRL